MTTVKAAPLGAPPPRAAARSLGEPPRPTETRNNTLKPQITQLNVRMEKAKHREIKIAAMNEDMDLVDYVVMCHDLYQSSGKRKRA
jgi:predicted HicB family RNase H-like nuclease